VIDVNADLAQIQPDMFVTDGDRSSLPFRQSSVEATISEGSVRDYEQIEEILRSFNTEVTIVEP